MANELLTGEDIIRGKKNFDAFTRYLEGSADELVLLPSGKQILTREGIEADLVREYTNQKAGLRNVGDSVGNLPEVKLDGVGLTGMGTTKARSIPSSATRFSDINDNAVFAVNVSNARGLGGSPSQEPGILQNFSFDGDKYIHQCFADSLSKNMFFRIYSKSTVSPPEGPAWSMVYHSTNTKPYTTTTATSANVVVTSTGELQRSTSSLVFKTDIEDIELPDYRAALKAVRPVSYRSNASTADNTDWSWYSFIAEEVAAIDPRLVQMSSTEFFEDTDEDGNTFVNHRELPEGEYAPSGLNINGIVTLMARINQYMLADIEKLEDEKTQLKRRMTNLEKRMDAFDGSTPAE